MTKHIHGNGDIVLISQLYDLDNFHDATETPYYSLLSPLFCIFKAHVIEAMVADSGEIKSHIGVRTIKPVGNVDPNAIGDFATFKKDHAVRAIDVDYIIPITLDPLSHLRLEIKRFEYSQDGTGGFCNVRVYDYFNTVTVVVSECIDSEGVSINECLWSIGCMEQIATRMSPVIMHTIGQRPDNWVHAVPARPDSARVEESFSLTTFEHTTPIDEYNSMKYEGYAYHQTSRAWIESQIGVTFDPIQPPQLTRQFCTPDPDDEEGESDD